MFWFSCTVTQKKLLLASVCGALIACICLWLPIILWWRLFFGAIFAFVISIRILFRGPQIKTLYGKYIIIPFFMAILLGGSIGLLQKWMGEESFSVWQMLVLPLLFSTVIKKLFQRYLQKKSKLLYDVTLCFDGVEYSLKGLLDTGNGLVEPISKKAVCIVGRDVFKTQGRMPEFINENLAHKFRVIPYHSVGKENGILYGYEMERLIINTDERKVIIEKPMIGISDVAIGSPKSYQIILQPELLREGEK